MSRTDIGDGSLPSDLTAAATISADGGCAPFTYLDEGQLEGDRVERLAGSDRIATSVAISREAFPTTAPTAVVARADLFADALAAAGLAAEVGGPILLTGSDALDERVRAELDRLQPGTILLAGGEAALSAAVAEAAEAEGRRRVVRLGGVDRYATAALLADEMVTRGGDVPAATVALGDRPSGDAWPDALAAGNVAVANRQPTLLVTPDVVPQVTFDALQRLLGDGGSVLIAGGPAAVSTAVEQSLVDAGFVVERAAGDTRFSTAVALAERALAAGASDGPIVLASGRAFPDALAAAPLLAVTGGRLLLTEPDELVAPVTELLAASAEEIDLVYLAGGQAALSGTIATEALEAILDDPPEDISGGDPTR